MSLRRSPESTSESNDSWRKGYAENDMAIDGILSRRTSFGGWRERYFRTTLYELSYWSRQINEIKMTRVSGGRYSYAPIGSASETFDLRIPGTSIASPEPTLIEFRRRGKVILDARAPDEETARRWMFVLTRILRYEKSLASRSIGSIRVQIDGLYVLGDDGPSKVNASVVFDDDLNDDDDVQASRRSFFAENGKGTTTSEPAALEVQEEVLYENTDDTDDVVSYAQVKLDTGAVPVRRANSGFTITVSPADNDEDDDHGRHYSTMLEKLFSPSTTRHDRSDTMTSPPSLLATSPTKPSVVASHRATLFEVQYLAFAGQSKDQPLYSYPTSALDGDATGRWPAAPDGRQPKPGYLYYPLFAKDAKDDSEEEAPAKIAAILHAKLSYQENLLKVVDLDGKERFEFVGVDEEVGTENNGDENQESTTDALVSVLARLSLVYEKGMEYLGVDIFAWDSPYRSLICWIIAMALLLSLPSSASFSVIPLIIMTLILSAHGTKYVDDLFRVGQNAQHLAEHADRDLCVVRIALLKASKLPAADYDWTTGKPSDSDAFAVLLAGVEDSSLRKSDQIAPTLVGITEVRSNTLDPVWIHAENLLHDVPYLDSTGNRRRRISHIFALPVHSHETIHRAQTMKTIVPPDDLEDNDDVLHPPGKHHHDDEFLGVDATKVSSRLRSRISEDGNCFAAPADFRATWTLNVKDHKVILPASGSYAFPVLQERERPWASSLGAATFEVFDSNLSTQEMLLGRARLPLRSLAAHFGEPAVYELPLEPSAVPKRNRGAIQRTLENDHDAKLGSIRVVAALEKGVVEADDRLERAKRGLAADVFERKQLAAMSTKKAKVSAYGNVKDLKRSLKGALDTAEFVTSTLERILALLTWEYPGKTLVVTLGLVAGITAMLLIPNNLLVAAFVSKLFLTGLVVKFKVWWPQKQEDDAVKCDDPALKQAKQDPTEVQLFNFVKSLPNAPQRDRALANRRLVARAQAKRNDTRARIGLHFGLRVRFQNYLYVHLCEVWERKYAVLVDRDLRLYDSMTDAVSQDHKKKLTHKFHLVPADTSMGGCLLDDGKIPVAVKDSLPAQNMTLFHLGVYVPVHDGTHTLELAHGDASFHFKPFQNLFAVKTRQAFDIFNAAINYHEHDVTPATEPDMEPALDVDVPVVERPVHPIIDYDDPVPAADESSFDIHSWLASTMCGASNRPPTTSRSWSWRSLTPSFSVDTINISKKKKTTKES